MAHLAAWANDPLAIDMQPGVTAGQSPPILSFRADDVFHHRIGMTLAHTERPARHGADVLLELADDAGFHGPMTGIVHTRGDFIDGDFTIPPDEQLHPEHADIIERFRNRARNV